MQAEPVFLVCAQISILAKGEGRVFAKKVCPLHLSLEREGQRRRLPLGWWWIQSGTLAMFIIHRVPSRVYGVFSDPSLRDLR